MRIAIIGVCVAAGAISLAAREAAEPPVVPQVRLRIGETSNAWQWREIMTDGSVRESEVAKPKPAAEPVRVLLIATNDVGWAWRFDYETRLSDQRVITNSSFRPKPPRERLAGQLALDRPPMPDDPVAEARESVADTRDMRAMAREMELVREVKPSGVVTQRMERRAFVASSKMLDADRAEFRMTDGAVVTQTVRRVVGKRLASLDAALARPAPPKAPEKADPPLDAGHAAAALIGGAAALAAAAALKKGMSK